MKTLDQHFADWEMLVFGYGYGTGEPHVFASLMGFMAACPANGPYEYEVLEKAVTAPVAWLLINALCRSDIINYGTSPRFGWLTKEGKALKGYLDSRTIDDLLDLEPNETQCWPDLCQCQDGACHNPFWCEKP